MKKVVVLLLSVLLLAACQSAVSDFSEVKKVPADVQDIIQKQELLGKQDTLYMVNQGDGTAYLVFRASGEVSSSVDSDNDTSTIRLNTKADGSDMKIHVFQFKQNEEGGTIIIEVNGKQVPLDNVFLI
ncbi:hypothetical protein NCCP2716_08520 [Sporosarcina sp. NCCP-2716]|uniref:hypothetical protein n=1 Tax=Sporosarcina sp. NCCP-2716 TaxID=2943679 RepID=UPI0020401545|nr:hypothetical protein [Sporosarcina sp. NCCP-2716]GKV68354.1 hypothetical protein NCCP2716_08520 [Sporosarcina sp. NCCP-2716]